MRAEVKGWAAVRQLDRFELQTAVPLGWQPLNLKPISLSPFKPVVLPDGTVACSDDCHGGIRCFNEGGSLTRDLSSHETCNQTLAICISTDSIYVYTSRGLMQLSISDGVRPARSNRPNSPPGPAPLSPSRPANYRPTPVSARA